MCGRFTLAQSVERVSRAFQVEIPELEPRYNIAPTQPAPVVYQPGPEPARQFTYMHWGLIPSWSKDPKIGARLFNARSETVTEKPSFRAAFKRRRCLVVADGFYEWQRLDCRKQPFYIYVSPDEADSLEGDRPPFGFAGLWEHWQNPDGNEILSCTILTTEPNDVLRPIHNRMPVILNPDDYERWLSPTEYDPKGLQSLLCPYDVNGIKHYPVSALVNNARYDNPDCIQPLSN